MLTLQLVLVLTPSCLRGQGVRNTLSLSSKTSSASRSPTSGASSRIDPFEQLCPEIREVTADFFLRLIGMGEKMEIQTTCAIEDEKWKTNGLSSMVEKSLENNLLAPAHPLQVPNPASLPPTPVPPADGGFWAWAQVLVGHLVMFNTCGYINSFGFFQAYYTNVLDYSPSDVSWIVSVQIFLLSFIGVFPGRITDAGYYRHTLICGSAFQLLAVFTTPLARSYWQICLAQGICGGIGNRLLFGPTVALVSTYFTKKRSVALAIVLSGSGTGGIIFPLVGQQLLSKVGYGWTVRVMGFIILLSVVIAISLARTRVPLGTLVLSSSFLHSKSRLIRCS